MEKLLKVSDWIGRTVRWLDDDGDYPGLAIVLAVDDTAHAPSAWIKYPEAGHPAYRSVDLSDLTDIETGEGGPRWGTGGPEAAMAEARARRTTLPQEKTNG